MDADKTLLIALVMVVALGAWLINNWIRAKHGFPIEDSWGRKVEPAANAENLRLKAENRELNDKLDAMQDRVIVLEKIVTDRGYSLAEEIEALRADRRQHEGSGVPLVLDKTERA